MEYNALSKNVKVSPRKVRLVADSIRELTIARAMTQLMVSKKRGAVSIQKTLSSAIANAVNNNNAKKDDLKIKTINITEGIKYKRYHFAGRGRTRPYMKRTSHINIILEDAVTTSLPAVSLSTTPAVTKNEEVKVIKNEKKMDKEKKGAIK